MATERRIHCPAGHHIPFTMRINETGFVECWHQMRLPPGLDQLYEAQQRGDAQQMARVEAQLRAAGFDVPSKAALALRARDATPVRCGLWVFIFAIRGAGVVVAQVSLDEMEEMRELQTPTAMLEYLRIWPNRKAG
jgi:hypothetical protein